MSACNLPPGLFSDSEIHGREFNSPLTYNAGTATEPMTTMPREFGNFEPRFKEFNNFPYGTQSDSMLGLLLDSLLNPKADTDDFVESVDTTPQSMDPALAMPLSKASSLAARSPIAPPAKGALIAPPTKAPTREPQLVTTNGVPSAKQVLTDLKVPKSSEIPAAPAKSQKRRNLSKYNAPQGKITTLMMRNVPCRFSQDDMMVLLDSEGFMNTYDFVYLPSNSSSNLGYGFINFPDPEDAARCQKLFTGYKFPGTQSIKVCEVHIAHIQGLENNIKHFHRTSAKKIMMRKPYIKSEDENGLNSLDQMPQDPKATSTVPDNVPFLPQLKRRSPDATATQPTLAQEQPMSFSGVEVVPVSMKNFFVEDSDSFFAQSVL